VLGTGPSNTNYFIVYVNSGTGNVVKKMEFDASSYSFGGLKTPFEGGADIGPMYVAS
jgi:hypothetical protein